LSTVSTNSVLIHNADLTLIWRSRFNLRLWRAQLRERSLGFVSTFRRNNRLGWPRQKVLSRLLVALAATGTLAGLAFVYSSDLPQIHDLGHYRPISNTVLYDDQGREFGSFALQRRILAEYEDYPKVLYDAVLSIEDKNFEKHSGF
jgi:membrane peptidoglycan carboxypeptidase